MRDRFGINLFAKRGLLCDSDIFKELDNSSTKWTLWEKLNWWIYIPNKCECFLIRMGTSGEVVEEKEGLQEKSTPAQDQIVAVIGDPPIEIQKSCLDRVFF